MRTAGRRLEEFRRPVLDAFWLPGTLLTLLWAIGFRCFFLAWIWIGQCWSVRDSTPAQESMVRLTTAVTWVHAGLLVLLVLDGFTLWRRARERSATPWAAWCLAFGILKLSQAGTTSVDLTHRLWIVKRSDAEAHVADARRHFALERYDDAHASYEAGPDRSHDRAWWRESLWMLAAHPDDPMHDPERAWRLGQWMQYGGDPRDRDVAAAILAARGEFDRAVRHLAFELEFTPGARESIPAEIHSARERRLALYRTGEPPPREPPYPRPRVARGAVTADQSSRSASPIQRPESRSYFELNPGT